MRVFFIGFGQAGGKVVDMFMEQDKTHLFRAVVVNTARTDLLGLRHIPMKDRVLIGQTVVKGHGVGTDNALGATITRDEIDSIVTAIEGIGTHDIDAFVIVAGLGGGTGSGGTPVLARHLKTLYQEPVYTIGIIPSPEEGRLYSYNAARSLTTLVNVADNTFIFDNAAWRKEGESIKTAYDRINDEIVRRFGVLFRAGEVGQHGVGEMVVDSSEIINTLRGGGITTVGFAKTEAVSARQKQREGALSALLGGLRRKEGAEQQLLGDDRSAKILSLVRSAVLGRLTLPCNFHSANRALILLVGPPEEMDRKGVEKARSWIEEQIEGDEIRSGDYPIRSSYVAAIVVLASVSDAPRIRDLLEMAKETKEELARQKPNGRTMFQDGIEPLFENDTENAS
ncbi:MAG TPA: tubulin/FtsZ family protein [Methanoregulaceae archaeon]|nr:tubulin/FtsZ family protein [Methanoregulaceae archaeon]HOV67857.1 tubulin/FtsZ family protein [Methanoregulaceae archaeon]HQJ88266.1 tubulin/FtsZ family protein [Methanoregulaceae archaeon]